MVICNTKTKQKQQKTPLDKLILKCGALNLRLIDGI